MNYKSVLISVQHYLDCIVVDLKFWKSESSSIIVGPKIRKSESSNFVVLFNIVLAVLGPLHFHMSFRIGLYFLQKSLLMFW